MATKRMREGLEIGSACEHESDSKLTDEGGRSLAGT
jgi:hypothetical protein